MGRFIYLTEYFTKDGIDFSQLTLQQRLFMSIVLTKYRFGIKKTYAEMLFGECNVWTPRNFKAYDKLITDIIDSSSDLLSMVKWLKDNAKVLAEGKDCSKGKYKVNAYEIDITKVFYTRNADMHSISPDSEEFRNGLSQIAWKAFALAAATHNIGAPIYRMIPVYGWVSDNPSDASVKAHTNITNIKRSIEKWLEKTNISGEFIKKANCFIVAVNTVQKKNRTAVILGGAKKPGQTKEQQKFIEALEKKSLEA